MNKVSVCTSVLNKLENNTDVLGILSTIEIYLMLLSGNINQAMEHLNRNQSNVPTVAYEVLGWKHIHLLFLISVDEIPALYQIKVSSACLSAAFQIKFLRLKEHLYFAKVFLFL